MKRLSIIFCLALIGTKAQSQIKAVTETGREVILNDDNTWRYANQEPSYDTRLDTLSFKKNANATFLVKSEKSSYGFYINPKAWSFKLNETDEFPSEHILQMKRGDAGAMTIPLQLEIAYGGLHELILKEAQKKAVDARITREEVRKINGNTVLLLEMHMTISGVKLAYINYYYSDKNGTFQFMSWTSENQFKQYKEDMEDLLNGFVVLDKKAQGS